MAFNSLLVSRDHPVNREAVRRADCRASALAGMTLEKGDPMSPRAAKYHLSNFLLADFWRPKDQKGGWDASDMNFVHSGWRGS